MEYRAFFQYQVDPIGWYREDVVLLFYVDGCLFLSPYKDKIDDFYFSLQAYFNIEDYRDINKYLGIDLCCRPDGSIHLIHPYLSQSIRNLIPVIYKSSDNINPVINPPPEKMRDPN